MLRRAAVLLASTLVVLGLGVPVAQAQDRPDRLPGSKTVVLRGDASVTRTAALRRAALVAGEPATQKHSTWMVDYTGFAGHDDAKAAFQRAVDVWASIVHSTVPIKVSATFTSLPQGVLGQAGSDGINRDPAIGDGTSWYPDALADALVGTDNAPGYYDIDAEFNSTEPDIYYGTDGAPGFGQVDFESVVLHELGHGLGFSGSTSYDGSKGYFDALAFNPAGHFTVYDTFLETGAGTALTSLANGSTTLGGALRSPVYWKGAQAKAANGGAHVRLYSPATWEGGSSIAHLDESTFPNGSVDSLMTPYLNNGESVHRPGPIVLGVLRDLGWVTTLSVPSKVVGVTADGVAGGVDLTWTRPAENGAGITSYTISYTDNGSAPVTVVTGTPGTSSTVTGLQDGHTYVFTVAATNAVGTGPASDPSPGVIPGTDVTPPTVSFTDPPAVTTASGSFSFAGTDPGRPGATLAFRCAIDANPPAACTSPYAFNGLTEGPHTVSVTAKDSSGNESAPAVTHSFQVDATPPAAAFTSDGPAAAWGSTTATFTFSGSDDRTVDVRFTCQMDSGPVALCTSPRTYNGLSNAAHVFKVASVDEAGNRSPVLTHAFTVDTVNPTVTPNVLPVFTTGSTVGLRYSGSDAGSGIASYDLRYRRGAFNTSMGPLTYPSSWQGTTATVKTTLAAKGYTYCFSVRSRDKLGHLSPWSAERCTATALDDRSLAASTGWTRGTSSAYYGSTVTSTSLSGRTLTRTSVQARRIALVATTCRGCGTVGVYWNGTLLRTVSLNATATTYRRVISVSDLGAIRSGTLVVKTIGTGRTYVDGLGLSRA